MIKRADRRFNSTGHLFTSRICCGAPAGICPPGSARLPDTQRKRDQKTRKFWTRSITEEVHSTSIYLFLKFDLKNKKIIKFHDLSAAQHFFDPTTSDIFRLFGLKIRAPCVNSPSIKTNPPKLSYSPNRFVNGGKGNEHARTLKPKCARNEARFPLQCQCLVSGFPEKTSTCCEGAAGISKGREENKETKGDESLTDDREEEEEDARSSGVSGEDIYTDTGGINTHIGSFLEK